MLSDRNYYGNPIREKQNSTHMSFVAMLILANVAVYILQTFLPPVEIPVSTPDGMQIMKTDKISESFSLVSTAVRSGQIFRVFTYMFIHGGFGHILFNMWGLYLFGSLLESKIGSMRFISLYFLSGLLGAAFWLSFNWSSPIPCIGASGALFGVIIATAMFFPDLQIMLLIPPIPMKLKTFAVVYVVAEIFFEMTSIDGGIAHIVHLGGGLGGYIFVALFCRGGTTGIGSFFKRQNDRLDKNLNSEGWSIKAESVSQKELDRLLDKISAQGINSLSEEEMETLRRAREEMKSRE